MYLAGIEGGGRKFLRAESVQQWWQVGGALQELRDGLRFDRGGESLPGSDDSECKGLVASGSPLGDGFGLNFGWAIRSKTCGQDGAAEFDGGGRE